MVFLPDPPPPPHILNMIKWHIPNCKNKKKTRTSTKPQIKTKDTVIHGYITKLLIIFFMVISAKNTEKGNSCLYDTLQIYRIGKAVSILCLKKNETWWILNAYNYIRK